MALGVCTAAEAGDNLRFHAIFASVPECVKLIDASGRLIDMNPAGLRMIDAPSLDSVRNRNIVELIAPPYRQAFREALTAVFEGKVVRLQFEVMGFAGRKLWMDQSAAPLFDAGDRRRVLEMVAVTRDITAQRQAEAELLEVRIAEEMARSRAEFLAGVGRDINVPLNDVIGYGELLQEAALDQGRHGDAADLQRVIDAARQILSVIHRMAGASLAAPRPAIRAGQCDLQEVFEDAIEAARTVLEANGNDIVIELPREPVLWGGDSQKLDLCLRSLLVNVAKLAQNGSIVARLLARRDEPWIGIEIAATAIPAPPAAQEQQPAPCVQGGFESNVALPKRLARLMGGDLVTTSAHDGDTLLVLTLPA